MYICLEIVVVGTGEKILRLDPEIHSYLKKHNILLEVQDTVSFVVEVHPLIEICENLKKLRKHFHLYFYNSVQTWYMFSIS